MGSEWEKYVHICNGRWLTEVISGLIPETIRSAPWEWNEDVGPPPCIQATSGAFDKPGKSALPRMVEGQPVCLHKLGSLTSVLKSAFQN